MPRRSRRIRRCKATEHSKYILIAVVSVCVRHYTREQRERKRRERWSESGESIYKERGCSTRRPRPCRGRVYDDNLLKIIAAEKTGARRRPPRRPLHLARSALSLFLSLYHSLTVVSASLIAEQVQTCLSAWCAPASSATCTELR